MAPSIHDCCKTGDSAGVMRCLDDGDAVQLELERPSGFTPLMVAAWYGHDDVVSVLLQQGADANRRLNTASYANGVTPLFMAARNGWAKAVMLLLGARADPELRRVSDGATPLATAAKHGRTEVIQVLLRAGATVDSPDSDDSTPLLLATKHGHPSTVELLLKSGAEPNGSTAWRPNALVVAAHKDDVPIIDAILRAKPGCVNMKLPNGATALHMAAACGNVAAATRLLDAGANPERCRRDGQTAASLASANGHEQVRHLIIESLAVVEGRRPAVSKLQRLKRLQQSTQVMKGLRTKSASTPPSERPDQESRVQQQLGRGARAFASFGPHQDDSSHGSTIDQRPFSAKSIQSSATSSLPHSTEGGSDDDDAGTGSASAWGKLRLVTKLDAIRREVAGDSDDDQLATMKHEIVNSVPLLSKRGYQLVIDMLAVDGSTDETTLEVDDLPADIIRGLHALVTDSTNHSKRHRHHSKKQLGSSTNESAEQSETSPGANLERATNGDTDAKDAVESARTQPRSDSDPTAVAVSERAASRSDRHRRHHHHHHHHHHKHHNNHHDQSPSSNHAELDHLREAPRAEPEVGAQTSESVRLPPIVGHNSSAESQQTGDGRPRSRNSDQINLPEIDVANNSSSSGFVNSSTSAEKPHSIDSRGKRRGSQPNAAAGSAKGVDSSLEPETRNLSTIAAAQRSGARERRGSAISNSASDSTIVSAQTDSDDERIATAMRQ